MPRILILLPILLLAACSGAKQPPVLPPTAAGGWHLQETKQQQAKTVGIYAGPGSVRVEIEDTGNPAVAFERAQKTRQLPDTVFFDKGPYFVTVSWEKADREALRQLIRELQKSL